MTSAHNERDRKVAAFCLIAFAFLLVSAMLLELVLVDQTGGMHNLRSEFAESANLGFLMPYFLVYLAIGAVGLIGTLGIVEIYSAGSKSRLLVELTRLAALGTFAIKYWLWSASWIVLHKVTTLTDVPTNPDPWVLEEYSSLSESIFALGGWGGLGPELVLFVGLALLLFRGARLLPRSAAICFLGAALLSVIVLVGMGLKGMAAANTSGGMLVLDLGLHLARLAAFLLAGAAMFTEKGVFARSSTRSSTRVRR